MTEQEWLASSDPAAMYSVLRKFNVSTMWWRGRMPGRKIQLLGAAFCRLVWPLIVDDRCRRMVEYQERQYDEYRSMPVEERDLISRGAEFVADNPVVAENSPQSIAEFAIHCAQEPGYLIGDFVNSLGEWGDPKERERLMAHLIRDIFGNPFKPIRTDAFSLTPTVQTLAQQMYDSFDFSSMPILADALQDAGCDNDDILAHCRSDGPHVRGCHVLDALLGKE